MTLAPSLRRMLSQTGFLVDGAPAVGLMTADTMIGASANTGRYAFIFNSARFPLPVVALFRSGGVPTITFIDAGDGEPEDSQLLEWHRLSWNFGLTPLLWVSGAGRATLLDSYQPPSGKLSDVVLADFDLADQDDVRRMVTVCGRMAFDTGAFWGSDQARRINRQGRVDSILLRELGAVERCLCDDSIGPLLAQKLIGRVIFSQYLVDRGLLRSEFLQDTFGHFSLSGTLRNADAAHRLFDWMRTTFNGDLFPPDLPSETDLFEARHLTLLADFLDGLEVSTGQWRLFPFRFDVIPVELISSIYEQFAHSVAGQESVAQGLHYTPINLVDLTLDRILDDVPCDARVLDPACGSGVFLVEAMRRIVWRRAQVEPNSRALVRDVLHNQIFGVDINLGALQVTAFSLYLAALELDPEVHDGDLEWLRFDRLIGRSLHHASFFDAALVPKSFSVIVGNPPWTYVRGEVGAKAGARAHGRVAQPRRSPDWAFLWRSRELAKPGARIALLMKATPFFSKEAAAVEARRMLLGSFRDVHLLNLSQLRGEGLFPTVEKHREGLSKVNAGPALLFSGRVGPPADDEVAFVGNVAWTKHFRRHGVLAINPDAIRAVPVARLRDDPVMLKAAVFGNDREYAVMRSIQDSPILNRLGRWCAELGIRIEQGLQLGGGAHGDVAALIGLPFLDALAYKPVRLAHERLRPFMAAYAHRPRDRAIYRAPLVICPEASFSRALQRGRYSAAVTHADLVYTDSFVGVSFADVDARFAAVLAVILNSKLTAFLLAFGGSNLGLKQPKVEKVDLDELPIPNLHLLPHWQLDECVHLLERLSGRPSAQVLKACDKIVFDLYGLTSADRRVVDDVLARSRLLFMDTQEERNASVASAPLAQLLDYGAELAHWLDTVLRKTTSFRTVVNRGVRVAADVIAVRFDLDEGPVKPLGSFRIGVPDLFEIDLLDALKQRSGPSGFGRTLRIYSDRSFYIIKPDERRFWTLSDAQTDVCHLVDDQLAERTHVISKVGQNDVSWMNTGPAARAC